MKNNINIFLIILLFFFQFIVTGLAETQITGTSDLEKNTEEKPLLLKTMNADINTASYYELISWCRMLGLSEKGNKKTLQQQIRQYYKITEYLSDSTPESEAQVNVITINTANDLEYFKISDVDEKYVRVTGDVCLEMADKENNSIHRIKADSILFNQSENTISAYGNVKYTMETKDHTEIFSGESLSFNTDNWDGIFFRGTSEKERKIKENSVTFYYSGQTIIRSINNTVILDKGIITSCDKKDPHYNITAGKIWVLAPNEWALSNALLYIGRIPILYIPFFFHPGDDFFFHPSIGIKEEEGIFLQTTSYLLGEKSEDNKNGTISFLQNPENDEKTEKEIDGLFLRQTDSLDKKQKDLSKYSRETNSYIKLLFDIYSRFGIFFGIDGKISSINLLKYFNFYLGIGRSREIFNTNNTYTPYYRSENGEYISLWDSSYLFGINLPFRYGIDLDLSLGNKYFNLKCAIPSYSDPYFLSDFNDRNESINWAKILGFESGEDISDTTETTENQNTLWYLNFNLTPELSFSEPYLSEAKISKLDISMHWSSRKLPESALPFVSETFYYPESYLLPGFSGKISGTLFSTIPKKKEKNDNPEKNDEIQMRNPWIEVSDKDIYENNSDFDFKIPDFQKDIPIKSIQEITFFKQALTYAVSPDFSIDNRINSTDWKYPSDIDFSTKYSVFNTKGNANIKYNFKILENLLIFSDSTILSANYKKHFNSFETETDEWINYIQQDYSASYMKVVNNLSNKIFPFQYFDPFKLSNLEYKLNTILYKKEHSGTEDVFTDSYFKLDKDFISAHNLNANIKFTIWNELQQLNMLFTLPPLENKISSNLTIKTGPLISSIDFKVIKPDEDTDIWDLQPLTINEKLLFLNNSFLKQTMTYDFEPKSFTTSKTIFKLNLFDRIFSLRETFIYNIFEKNPTESITELNLWFFYAKYNVKYTESYSFTPENGWETDNSTDFLPSSVRLGFKHNFISDPLWKNKIKISANTESSWKMDLLKYTDNLFLFNFDLKFKIDKFIDLQFSSSSENKATYRYFPNLTENVGFSFINPFMDLMKSFNLFNSKDRKESYFNLKVINFTLVHHLHDWDLNIKYSGKPELITNNEIKSYEWSTSLTIFLQWNPIPEIKSEISLTNEEISF